MAGRGANCALDFHPLFQWEQLGKGAVKNIRVAESRKDTSLPQQICQPPSYPLLLTTQAQ